MNSLNLSTRTIYQLKQGTQTLHFYVSLLRSLTPGNTGFTVVEATLLAAGDFSLSLLLFWLLEAFERSSFQVHYSLAYVGFWCLGLNLHFRTLSEMPLSCSPRLCTFFTCDSIWICQLLKLIRSLDQSAQSKEQTTPLFCLEQASAFHAELSLYCLGSSHE